MTADELDALPIAGDISYVDEEQPDGTRLRRPVLNDMKAMFHGEDDVMLVRDRCGEYWTTGWIDGVLYKRRTVGP